MLFGFLNLPFTISCTIIHLCLHSVSPCIRIHIRFQLPVSESRQPWPGLYLTKTALHNPKREGSVFLSGNAHFFPVIVLQSCIAQFWGRVTAGLKNWAMQSLCLQPLPAEIAHYAIPAVSSQTGLCIAQFQQSISLPATQTVPYAVLAVNLPTSWRKLGNLHDQSHRYVTSQFSSSFWFLTDRLLAMSVAMSPGIAGVHLPLSNTCTMVSRRAETKTPFKAHLGMQSIKCLWTCLPMKTSRYDGNNITTSSAMNNSRRQHTRCNECERKFVDNIETKQSCKLK